MTSITLTGLTRRFGTTVAVDSVDLSIASRELFFLLGPSGCGKTTLLRLIAGFDAPDAGEVIFGNRTVTRVPPNRRNAGMVFQSYALWPHMTVFDNVAYGLRVRRWARARRRERVLGALRAVHMERLERRRPAELSGGQQQRVALARALVIEPTVLLLDEPLSNLDASLRLEMRAEVRGICAQAGITTIYVTHDQNEAISMADRLAVMSAGRIVQVGAPRAVYTRPRSRFVAGFVGETNLLPAAVRGPEGTAVVLETPAGTLRSTAGERCPPPGSEVICSIRPESIRIASGNDPARRRNRFAGRGLRSVFLGQVTLHLIALPDGRQIRAVELATKTDVSGRQDLALSVDSDDVVVLDQDPPGI